MPVVASWMDEDQSIIKFTYSGDWEWQEAFAMLTDANQMIQSANNPVAVIVDMTDGQRLPPHPMENIGKLAQGRGQSANDSGITIFLNADVLTKAMQDVIQMTGAEVPEGLTVTYARSLDEAIQKANEELERLLQ